MFFDPPNRLAKFFPVEPPPSPGDELIRRAHGVKLELLKFTGDDTNDVDLLISYEIHGTLEEGDAALLTRLLSQFRSGGEGTVSQ